MSAFFPDSRNREGRRMGVNEDGIGFGRLISRLSDEVGLGWVGVEGKDEAGRRQRRVKSRRCPWFII